MIVKSSELTRTRRKWEGEMKEGGEDPDARFWQAKSDIRVPGRRVQNQARKIGGAGPHKQKTQGRVVDGEAAGCWAQVGCELTPCPRDLSGQNPALFLCH